MATAIETLAANAPQRIDLPALVAELGPGFAAHAAEHDAGDLFVAENFAVLKDRKMFSAGVPLELGGGGATYTELAAMLRETAHHCSSTALALAMHTHATAAAVWRWRNLKAPVEGLLRRIAAEQLVLVSSGGSDWLAGSGRAEKVEGGYRITGRKIFGSGSPAGDLLMTCAVYDDPQAGPTVLHFGVPLRAPGVKVMDNWCAMGMRGTGSNDVSIDGFFVADAAIGMRRPAGSWEPGFHLIPMIAMPLVYAVYLGIAEAARDLALAAAKKRQGDPGAAYLVGEMDDELTAARLAVDSMVEIAERSKPSHETTSAIFVRRTLAGRAVLRTLDKAMETAGGQAFERRFGLERLFRDAQGARHHPMSEKTQQRYSGRLAMGLDPNG
jgi:acyl-CoA dehydrogenase